MKRFFLITIIGVLSIAGSVFAQPPLVFSTVRGANTPISIQVLQEAYRRLGVTIQIETYPAERALVVANHGDVDGELYRIQGIEKRYPNLIRVPVVINRLEPMVFTRDTIFEVTGWSALQPYSIGIRRGLKYAEYHTKGMNVETVSEDEQILKKVASGRTDIGIVTRLTGLTILKELQISGVKILEPPLMTLEIFHYLHKKNENLVPKLTTVLQEMEQEGKIHAIREQAITALRQ